MRERLRGLSGDVQGIAQALESPRTDVGAAREAGVELEALLTGERSAGGEAAPVKAGDRSAGKSPVPLEPSGEWVKAGPLTILREMAFGEPELAPVLEPYRGKIRLAQGMVLAKTLLSTALSYTIGALVDSAIAHAFPMAAAWLGALVALTAVKALLQKGYWQTMGGLRANVRKDFRIHLFRHIRRLPKEATAKDDPRELANRLTQDASNISVKNVTNPVLFPNLLIQLGVGLGFVVATNWSLALMVIATIPALAFLSWRYGRKVAALQEDSASKQARMTRTAGELLASPRGDAEAERRALRDYGAAAEAHAKTLLDITRLSSTFDSLMELLETVFTELLVLGVGLFCFIHFGAPSIGQVMALRGYTKDLRSAVDSLLYLYTDSKDAEGSTRRVLELLRAKPEASVKAAGFGPKVVGGVEAAKGEFPFIVSLERDGEPFCGGSLVAKGWVLTAGHCARAVGAGGAVRVRVGAHDLRDPAGTEVFRIAEVVRHPKSASLEYDFALFRLDGESKFPPIALNRKELRGKPELVVAGWGRTSEGIPTSVSPVLQKAALPLVPERECSEAYADDPGVPPIGDGMLCAGFRGVPRGHSKGDSGGPLVMGSGADRVLVGVVSWHRPGKYGVYGKVSAAAPWIDGVIKRP